MKQMFIRRKLASILCTVSVAMAVYCANATGVSRRVEPVSGGCRLTLEWNLSGEAKSDLIIEEHYGSGWSVLDSTVPFSVLDASWFSDGMVKFAVKRELLARPGTISFMLKAANAGATGTASGIWKVYIGDERLQGDVSGTTAISTLVAQNGSSNGDSGNETSEGAYGNVEMEETAVAIKAFSIVDGGCELKYSGVSKAGILIVEGCEGLGKQWIELKRCPVSAGEGMIALNANEVGVCKFMRMKLLTAKE